MVYEVVVNGMGSVCYGEDRIKAEAGYHMYVSLFGKERNVHLTNENETLFYHDVRSGLWRERGFQAAKEERDCFYLHDGEKYQVATSKNYSDIGEYTEAELQMMYGAWVAGWTVFHSG